jgi:hypothetical protein
MCLMTHPHASRAERYLVPRVADPRNTRQGVLHVRHLHVQHALVALTRNHLDVLLPTIGQVVPFAVTYSY